MAFGYFYLVSGSRCEMELWRVSPPPSLLIEGNVGRVRRATRTQSGSFCLEREALPLQWTHQLPTEDCESHGSDSEIEPRFCRG